MQEMPDHAEYTSRAELLADIELLLYQALDDILFDIPNDRLSDYLDANPGVRLLVAIAGKLMNLR